MPAAWVFAATADPAMANGNANAGERRTVARENGDPGTARDGELKRIDNRATRYGARDANEHAQAGTAARGGSAIMYRGSAPVARSRPTMQAAALTQIRWRRPRTRPG